LQFAHCMWILRMVETRGLNHIDILFDEAMEKCITNINLPDFPTVGDCM
jgi:hypothetical protein